MHKISIAIIVVAAMALLQCSKKNDDPAKPDMVRGLLANFKLDNNFIDSTKKVTQVTKSATGLSVIFDRKGNLGAVYCKLGHMRASGINWKPYPISVSLWLAAFDDVSTLFIMGSNDGVFGIVQNGSQLGFTVSHPATSSAMAEAEVKKWTHIVGTFDGKDIRTYINGQLKATKHHPGNAEAITALDLAMVNNVNWRGTLDDLRIYDRLLSNEEVMILYNYY